MAYIYYTNGTRISLCRQHGEAANAVATGSVVGSSCEVCLVASRLIGESSSWRMPTSISSHRFVPGWMGNDDLCDNNYGNIKCGWHRDAHVADRTTP